MESNKKATAAAGRRDRSTQPPRSDQSKLVINQVRKNILTRSVKQPSAPPVYRPEARKIVQPKLMSQALKSPTAPPIYRPDHKAIARPGIPSAAPAHLHLPPMARAVHSPQAKQLNTRTGLAAQMKSKVVAPPKSHPQTVRQRMKSPSHINAAVRVHGREHKALQRKSAHGPSTVVQMAWICKECGWGNKDEDGLCEKCDAPSQYYGQQVHGGKPGTLIARQQAEAERLEILTDVTRAINEAADEYITEDPTSWRKTWRSHTESRNQIYSRASKKLANWGKSMGHSDPHTKALLDNIMDINSQTY